MATFPDLPLEIQRIVWDLACLPEPGVCHFDRRIAATVVARIPIRDWTPWDCIELKVPKRRYPAAAHVCRASRECALSVQEREQTCAARHALEPIQYYIGHETRPFDPQLDTFFIKPHGVQVLELLSFCSYVTCSFWKGSRLEVKHLALSTDCFDPKHDAQYI